MRRTAADRRPHLDFAALALKQGVHPAEAARQLAFEFGLSLRQARYDVKRVLVELHREGGAIAAGGRQTEDLCLTLRRCERLFRIALAKGDRRTALKVEKARCRLLGLYPAARQSPQELKERHHADIGEQKKHIALAHARRGLRLACRNGTAESLATAETQMAPPINRGHRENCECWMCNPEFQRQHDEERRRIYPRWREGRQAAVEKLAPLLPKWRGHDDDESEEEFAARVRRAALVDAHERDLARRVALGSPQPAEVEERLEMLVHWLEAGVARDVCRRRYQVKFSLPTRTLNAEWSLCLRRFRDEGRWITRRRNAALGLALGSARRDLLCELCLAADDYKLAVDIEIDRCRLLGLFPKERQRDEPLSERERTIILRAELDHLDPRGRGSGVPSDDERQLIAMLN